MFQRRRVLMLLVMGLVFCASFFASVSARAAQGDLDTTFGSPNGYVITSSTLGVTGANAAALQPDGKIVVAGYVTGTPRLFVARYNSDGSLDSGFGIGGTYSFSQNYSEAYAVAIHDGRIIVAGGTGGWGTGAGQMLVLCLTSAGALDPTFNDGSGHPGYVTWHNPDSSVAQWASQAFGLAVQPDGKIVVTGYTEIDYGSTEDLVLLRFNVNGTLDTTFGTNGVTQIAAMTYDASFGGSPVNDAYIEGKAVAIRPWDSKILVAAHSGNNHSAIYRFTTNGVLDTTFGPMGNGMTIPFSGNLSNPGGTWGGVYPAALEVFEYDRTILMAAINGNPSRGAVIVRYTENGLIDPNYGTGGQAVSWQDGVDWSNVPIGMALQDDGKAVLVTRLNNGLYRDIIVIRFTRGGVLDTTFGGGDGWVTFTGPLNENDEGMGVAIQPNGNIIAAGYTADGDNSFSYDAITLRYIGDPPTLAVSPPNNPFNFGSVALQTSRTQIFTLTNTGGMNLTINQIAVSGTNQSEFVKMNDTCSNTVLAPASLGVDEKCTFQIQFTPGAEGARTATLTIPSSDPAQSTHTVTLQGNGVTVVLRTLTISKAGAGSGSLTSSPVGIDCGPDCSGIFDNGTAVTVTASAAAGSYLSGWTGCQSVVGKECTVTMDMDRTVTATFELIVLSGFEDVPIGYWADDFIYALLQSGITGGCSPGYYCPTGVVTRGQMAVFLEAALGHSPNVCEGRFSDVPAGGFCGFIERMADDGITGGCGTGIYCPNNPVTRGQMSVFLTVALGKAANTCTEQFSDVPATNGFCGFIERLAYDGITGGCGTGIFCPDSPINREQMAIFLASGFLQ